ncbi:MAG: DMT family transporter [Muribaculaceae bacterium]|nr:DMT family transporter [Muribaculaceae bacterium]
MKLKGYILAALAAASYGTNPAFAVPLYSLGMNPNSVLLFRYLFGIVFLIIMMLWRRRSFCLERRQIVPVVALGVLMGISSLGLFESYKYMNSGIASTLLFVYPVMVALLMTFFFHERFSLTTGVCLVVMGAGLVLLLRTDGGFSISLTGCLLVFISSLTYALYIVLTNVSKSIQGIPTLTLLFYQLIAGSFVFVFAMAFGQDVTIPSAATGWLNLIALALIPTVISLMCTTRAIHYIGPTPTAIFGALEPVTAVVLSVTFLGQAITLRELIGGLLIVVATSIVVAARPIENALLRMRKMFPKKQK